MLFSCFVACLVPSSFFKNHANLFFNVHGINCIVLLWALLCAFVCQLLPLPLCERSLCLCAWFMLLIYVKTSFLVVSALVFYTSQLFFNVISCRCLFLSSGSFFLLRPLLFQLSSHASFLFLLLLLF